MRLRTLAVAAGISAPLILAAPSDAGFVGISWIKKPNAYDLMTLNVYAEFDNPGNDWMQAVGGTPARPLDIFVIGGGDFYHNPFGTDLAPPENLVELFPSLAFDSFFTIGIKTLAPGQQDELNLVNMPPLAGTQIYTVNGSWGLVPPTAPQGNPFDPVNSFPGNGSILIGQFSMSGDDGPLGIAGQFLLQFISDGVVGQYYATFENTASCLSDDHCDDGDPCNGTEWCDEYIAECFPSWPVPDCNDNWILDSCDIANGTSDDDNGNGIPDECECPADLDGNGEVGGTDFLALLDAWGPNPGHPADLDGDGHVGVIDFLTLLAAWGPCP
jgi:hypothetical protein